MQEGQVTYFLEVDLVTNIFIVVTIKISRSRLTSISTEIDSATLRAFRLSNPVLGKKKDPLGLIPFFCAQDRI